MTCVLLCAVLCGCGGPERKYPIAGTTHLPLLDKRTMVYEQRKDGETQSFSVRMNWLGGSKVRVFSLTIKGIDLGDCTFMQHDSAIVFVTTDPLTELESPHDVPDYRQTWVDELAISGDAWDDPDTGTRTVMAGYETVRVPAGTFEHCYKTVTESNPQLFDSLNARAQRSEFTREQYDSEVTAAKLVIVRWFAPGVGLVKEQIGSSEFVRELVEVENPGRGEFILPSETQNPE